MRKDSTSAMKAPSATVAEKKINPFVTWLPKPPADFGYDVTYIGDMNKSADDNAVKEKINAATLLGNPNLA
jgi:hypothetical protein